MFNKNTEATSLDVEDQLKDALPEYAMPQVRTKSQPQGRIYGDSSLPETFFFLNNTVVSVEINLFVFKRIFLVPKL